MAADQKLEAAIDELKESIGPEMLGLADQLKAEIKRSVDTDGMLEEKINKLAAGVLQNNMRYGKNFDAIFDELKRLNCNLEKFNTLSETMDETIDEKINRSVATILSRIEHLDNRVDAEITRARRAEWHLNRRLDALEGIPSEDDGMEPNPPSDGSNNGSTDMDSCDCDDEATFDDTEKIIDDVFGEEYGQRP